INVLPEASASARRSAIGERVRVGIGHVSRCSMTDQVDTKDFLGLEGQPSLVVGGGYGSGRLLALLLARAGARVAVVDIDAERAYAVATEVGGHAITADVRDESSARDAVEEARDALGGLSRVANIVGLVNMRPFLEMDSD